VGLEPLLLFVPPLHLLALLFKHISIVLEMLERMGENLIIQKKDKKFSFFVYVLLTQAPSWVLWINSIGLQRLSPKGEILSYTRSIYSEDLSLQ